MTDGPPDVRDSLTELEQRLLELERELRADATSDTSLSRQRVPVPRPPAPAAAPEPVAVAPESPPAGAGTQNPGAARSGPPDEAGGAGPARPDRPRRDDPRPSPDLEPLVRETQRRVDSLRDTLEGLTGASDRLREVAQVMVEDHGRALVRLERATAWQRAQAPEYAEPPAGAYAPEPPAAYLTPPEAPVYRPAPEPPAAFRPPPEPQPSYEPPAEAAGAAGAYDASEAVLAEERRARAARAIAEPEAPLRPDTVAAPLEPEALPGAERPPRARGGRRWLWWVVAPLLIAAGLATALLIFGGDDEAPGPGSTPGASSRIALDVDLGRARDAFESVPGTRPASDIGPEADLCDGVVGAAVVLRTAADETLPRCSGLVTIADGTVSARALAARGGSGGRPCVNADQASSLAVTRRNARLTASRQRAVQRAITGARRETLGAGLTASERVATIAEAAYDAGRRFDARRNLRLYAVRKRTGTECVVPGRDDVASGRYPLATRIELLTRARNAKLPAVQRAAVAIDNITSRPAPIDATVLRGSR